MFGLVWYAMVRYGMLWFLVILVTSLGTFVSMSRLKAHWLWVKIIILIWFGLVWYGMLWFLIILETFIFMSSLKSDVLIRFGMVWFGLVWYAMVLGNP